jgi:hypothetical protein
MGTTDYEFGLPEINRCAIVLEPTRAYLEWAKASPEGDHELTFEDIGKEGTVYLMPVVDAEPDAWLNRNYEAMFKHELDAWCRDDALWPRDRSFDAFKKFFEVRFCSIVLDMGQDEIQKDTTSE